MQGPPLQTEGGRSSSLRLLALPHQSPLAERLPRLEQSSCPKDRPAHAPCDRVSVIRGSGVPLAAVLCREPQLVSAVEMQVESVMQRESVLAELAAEAFEAFAFEKLSFAPLPAAVMPPSIIASDFLRRPALGIILRRSQVDHETHATCRSRHLPHFTPMESFHVVGICILGISRHFGHAICLGVVHHRLQTVGGALLGDLGEFAPERIRKHELEHHPSAKVEDSALVVQINEILRDIPVVMGIAGCRVMEVGRRHLLCHSQLGAGASEGRTLCSELADLAGAQRKC
mmetsp:Transcript_34370/g.81048  ORF Transcript_34370/g.81048 Transcript_34370/m.81048 type:complete len:287 (+) Transcript_34370:2985-3845(+)